MIPRIHTLALALMTVLGLAGTGHALDAIDKSGKVIGEVLYSSFGELATVRMHEGVPYIVNVERHRITGTDLIWYETLDCTGPAYLIFFPDQADVAIIYLSGIGADGQFYIPIPGSDIFEGELHTLWSAFTNRGCVVISENPEGPDEPPDPLFEYVTPTQPIGDIREGFAGPFNAK